MPSETSQKTLEMRVAELEDKLAKLQASQSAAGQYVPPCVVQVIPPCTQQVPYIPPCTQQVNSCYAAIPPCAVYIPPCCAYYAGQMPAQPAQNPTAIPPCSGAGKKDKSGAAKDPSCEDFGGLGS